MSYLSKPIDLSSPPSLPSFSCLPVRLAPSPILKTYTNLISILTALAPPYKSEATVHHPKPSNPTSLPMLGPIELERDATDLRMHPLVSVHHNGCFRCML